MVQKRLALTKDGKMTWCTADEEHIGKGRCNHIAHQKNNETNQEFVARAEKLTKKENFYGPFVPDEGYLKKLEDKLKKAFPQKILQSVIEQCGEESWIIAYGYDEDPYCNNGGWNKTEPYPFITSDGITFIDMYITKDDVYDINEDNFITAFNKNKDHKMTNGVFVLDRNKKLYKVNYPNVDKYDNVFIKHIPSY